MLCTTCDTHNDAVARFCRVCGTALVGPSAADARPPQARPVYTISNAPATGPTCPTCVRSNPAGAKYCVYCASALQLGDGLAFQPSYAVATGYTMPQSSPALTMNLDNTGRLLIRAIWFFVIGWWLGLLWSLSAWLFNLTLIGLPVGLMMLNATPTVTTLQHRSRQAQPHRRPAGPEHPLPLRAIWFLVIGWWASLIWILTAWAFSLTLLLMPISFWMWNRIPTITTLAAEQ